MSSTTDRRIKAIQRSISEKSDYADDIKEDTFEPFISELVSHTPPGFQHTFTYNNPAGYQEHFANTTTKNWLISLSVILLLAIISYFMYRRWKNRNRFCIRMP
jgi:hypothetical protein